MVALTSRNVRIGARVMTTMGAGSIISWRMAPPNYHDIEAVSVRLDARAEVDSSYHGDDVHRRGRCGLVEAAQS